MKTLPVSLLAMLLGCSLIAAIVTVLSGPNQVWEATTLLMGVLIGFVSFRIVEGLQLQRKVRADLVEMDHPEEFAKAA